MISETFDRVKTEVQSSGSIASSQKRDLQYWLFAVEQDVRKLPESQSHNADRIARSVERSISSATMRQMDPESFQEALADMLALASGFEASHPRLVADINYFGTVLANMGI